MDAAFRNVVPDFDDFVVASRNDVEDVYAVLIVDLGRTEMDVCLRGMSGAVSQTDPGQSHLSFYLAFQLHYLIVEPQQLHPTLGPAEYKSMTMMRE